MATNIQRLITQSRTFILAMSPKLHALLTASAVTISSATSADVFYSPPSNLTGFADMAYFVSVQDPNFWRGRLDGLYVYGDGAVSAVSDAWIRAPLQQAGEYLYFSSFSSVNDTRYTLRSIDASGTINSLASFGINHPGPSEVVWMNGDAWFAGYLYRGLTSRYDSVSSLWRSPAGNTTAQVIKTDIYPRNLTPVSGTLYFVSGNSLWRSDGSPEGTVEVRAFAAPPSELTALGDQLVFVAENGSGGKTLWGSSAGTSEAQPLLSDAAALDPRNLAAVGGVVYFSATLGGEGRELWMTDGLPAGTYLVKDISPSGDSDPGGFTLYQGEVIFSARSGTGRELWSTDGSAAGTFQLSYINSRGDAAPQQFTSWNDNLYFQANDGVHGAELWKLEGLESEARLVRDINPGQASSSPTQMTAVGNELLFTATDGARGYALWRFDGDSVSIAAEAGAGSTVLIDGNTSDWTVNPIIQDQSGDVAPADPVDWVQAWAISNPDELLIRYETNGFIDFGQQAWRYNVFLDTDQQSATGYKGTDNRFPLGADYLIQGGSLYVYAGSGSNWAWESLGYVEYSYSGAQLEMRVDTFSGIEAALPQNPHIMLHGDNPDNDDYAFLDSKAIDGGFTDWSGVASIAADPTGDAVADGYQVDWRSLWVTEDIENHYISYETNHPIDFNGVLAWGYQVLIDSDDSPDTGFTGVYDELGIGGDLLIQGGTLYHYAGGSGPLADWDVSGGTPLLYSYSGQRIEIALPRMLVPELSADAKIQLYGLSTINAPAQEQVDRLPDNGGGLFFR